MSHRYFIFNLSKAELIIFSQHSFLCVLFLSALHMASSSTPPLSWRAGDCLRPLSPPSPPPPYPSCAPASVHGTTTFSELIMVSIISNCFLNLVSGLIPWTVIKIFMLLVIFPSIPNTSNEAFTTFHLDHYGGLLTSPYDSGFSLS